MNRDYAHWTGTLPQRSAVICSSIPQPLSKACSSVSCPICGEHELHRIPRRAVDRLLSMLVEIRRFRCANAQCNWTGNLRRPGRALGASRIFGSH